MVVTFNASGAAAADVDFLHSGSGAYLGYVKGLGSNCCFLGCKELSPILQRDVFVGMDIFIDELGGNVAKGDEVVFRLKLDGQGRPQASFLDKISSGPIQGMNVVYRTCSEALIAYHLHIDNLIVVPKLLCDDDDHEIFHRLREGTPWPDIPRLRGSHYNVYNPRSDLYDSIISRICSYFRIQPRNSCINLYPDGAFWRPFHRDRYQDGESVTILASFGATRILTFKDMVTNCCVNIPLKNGMVVSFSEGINNRFVHGIQPLNDARHSAGRISISLWGMEQVL
jgi:hypothetical protein